MTSLKNTPAIIGGFFEPGNAPVQMHECFVLHQDNDKIRLLKIHEPDFAVESIIAFSNNAFEKERFEETLKAAFALSQRYGGAPLYCERPSWMRPEEESIHLELKGEIPTCASVLASIFMHK